MSRPLYAWLLLLAAVPVFSHETETPALTAGQTVYVPAYSHIYSGNREAPLQLTVTLSIRNVDPHHSIRLVRVDYYETQGQLQTRLLSAATTLGPFGSTRYVIAQNDNTGGSGANFLVQWESELAVNAPIIESIMIGAQQQQGISFTSRGRAILTHP